jgi:hypothetical protein
MSACVSSSPIYHTAVQLLCRIIMQYLSFCSQASTWKTSILNYSCIKFSRFVIIKDLTRLILSLSKTLQSDKYRSRNFDIILDCTSFTSKSEVPLQWLKYCAEVIPADIRERFSTTRILNANTLTQKYLRRLYNISAGESLYQRRCSSRL